LLGRFRTVLVAVNTFRSPPSTLVVAVSISIVFQALLTVVVFLLSKSLGLEIPIMDLAWIFAVASVAQMLPVSVAGIGMREGTIVYLLGQQGVSAPDALALSLLILTGNLIVAAIGAFSELWTTDQGKDGRDRAGRLAGTMETIPTKSRRALDIDTPTLIVIAGPVSTWHAASAS